MCKSVYMYVCISVCTSVSVCVYIRTYAHENLQPCYDYAESGFIRVPFNVKPFYHVVCTPAQVFDSWRWNVQDVSVSLMLIHLVGFSLCACVCWY